MDGGAVTDRLQARMEALARTMRNEPTSVEETLQSITQGALANVPGAAHAGITLVIGRREVESRAATSEIPRKLDELQHDLAQGPCLQAVFLHETVQSDDLTTETRWPQFCSAAVDLGVRSMLSFQLYTNEQNLGALNLYGAEQAAFDDESYEAGMVLAAHGAVALVSAQHQTQLRSAIASRDIIGQAKGMIMERYSIDAVQAFDLLSTLSQESNTKVSDIARTLVAREHPTD